MSIDSLRSGTIRLCFDPSLNVYPSKCRILIEGQMLTTGATAEPDTLIKIPALRDVDAQFGAGSVLAEGIKTAFGCCANQAMEFYALPRQDADVGATAKAVYTVTITGTATSDGRVDLYIADGRWNTSTHVVNGELDTAIAAAVAASLQADTSLPFTVTVATNIVTLTAKNAGRVGNGIAIIPNWHQRLHYLPTGITIDVEQTVQGAHS